MVCVISRYLLSDLVALTSVLVTHLLDGTIPKIVLIVPQDPQHPSLYNLFHLTKANGCLVDLNTEPCEILADLFYHLATNTLN